jgi:ribosomal subunit interface protein
MEVVIHAPHLTLGNGFKTAIEQKIGRVEQYEPRAVRAHVHIRKASAHHSKEQYVVTVHCQVPGDDVSAEDRGPDALTALDVVAEKIERRLRKRKTARLEKRVHGSPRVREKK